MDIKDRVMGDQPNDFLHKIAGIVPGYHGYVDRERRRDADKILRTGLARQFTTQRERLGRVQQSLLRGSHLEEIAEIDRLSGALQRFIDRLSVATYGYAGLFDPIKVEAADLDQLYTFDMALASGIDQVSSAIDGIETATSTGGAGAGPAGMPELPAAVSRLSGVLDELNARFNARTDLLTSGKRLPDTEYQALLGSLTPGGAPPVPPGGEVARYTPGAGGMGTSAAPITGMEGTPTTSFGSSPVTSAVRQPSDPSLGTLTGDNQSFTETPSGAAMRGEGPLPSTEIGAAGNIGSTGSGIETASSPVDQPGAPGGDIVHGLDMTTPEDTKPSV